MQPRGLPQRTRYPVEEPHLLPNRPRLLFARRRPIADRVDVDGGKAEHLWPRGATTKEGQYEVPGGLAFVRPGGAGVALEHEAKAAVAVADKGRRVLGTEHGAAGRRERGDALEP